MLYVGPGISAREAHQAKQKEQKHQRELFGERVDEHAAAPTLVHAGAAEPVGGQRYGSTLARDLAPADSVVPVAVAVDGVPLVPAPASPLLAVLITCARFLAPAVFEQQQFRRDSCRAGAGQIAAK